MAQRLRRPGAEEPKEEAPQEKPAPQPFVQPPVEPPVGFAGRSLLRPRATQTSPEFVPLEDRWRIGFPEWKRYERRIEAPYVEGRWWDPYNQNVLKGDFPVLGQHIFLSLSAISDTLFELRRIPLPSNVSAEDPDSAEFFGSGDQRFVNQNFILSLEVFKGDTAFKPRDWEFRITPVFNLNFLDVQETGVVNIDVREGTTRKEVHSTFQELFVEYHLGDLSPNYDFVSSRFGIQGFTSDFRGFIFSDNTLGFRLFGDLQSNQNQFNAAYFRPLEKDTNSGLNRLFDTRGQHLAILNYFRQDFLWLGYTAQLSFHYLHDSGGVHFDENGFLVRPAAVGFVRRTRPNTVDVAYLGWTGDGHIGPLNLTHAFYQALGRDTFNQIAGQPLDINAQMAALELSVDLDWLRPKASFFWASGDSKPLDDRGRGFDSIFDNPNFAGGGFSYWLRQGLPLTGTGLELVGRNSLLPSLRGSKIEGQPNFVNPGLFLFNVGSDVELTPKLKASLNLNFLRFHRTAPLELLLFQPDIRHDIGFDYSLGFRYRPFLNENVTITAGASALTIGGGLKDVYTFDTLEFGAGGLQVVKNDPFDHLYSAFLAVTFTY
ncbi:MAG: hypothetical protein HY726_21815 [Candidatus Rokubacteria bacterium]|nr:hypothetical protein [Candidatus Rokubacteria bacterium]